MKRPVFNPDWPSDVQAVYRHDMQEIWDPNIARHIWYQYHNQLNIYISLASGSGRLDILDVGCAQGTLALKLAESGHHVWALDIRESFLDYAASRYEKGDIHFVRGNVMEMEMDKKFDLIFANQIVEHMVYPLDLVKRLAGWLEPGGRLVMTTPNGNYVKSSLPLFQSLGDVSRYSHLQFTADGDGHFFAYTGKDLESVFRKAGLAEIKLTYFETPWISGHMKIRYLHRLVPLFLLRLFDRMTMLVPGLGKRFSHQIMMRGVWPA